LGDDAAPETARLIELFDRGLGEAVRALDGVADRDWSVRAGTLDWSCWQTVDHVTDCLFSYALQIAGQARDGWLRLEELHAQRDATPRQLLDSLAAVSTMFAAVLAATPADRVASDSVLELGLADWVARGLNEVLLHTSDVLRGFDQPFEPDGAVCSFVLSTPTLWMYDGVEPSGDVDAWRTMLAGSGRPVSNE